VPFSNMVGLPPSPPLCMELSSAPTNGCPIPEVMATAEE